MAGATLTNNGTTAGRLDRRITFQRAVEVQDGYGGMVTTWQDLATNATVWSEVMPEQGWERFQSQELVASQLTRFRMRYRSDISIEMRIVYKGENYDLKSVQELGRHEGLEIVAQKVQQ